MTQSIRNLGHVMFGALLLSLTFSCQAQDAERLLETSLAPQAEKSVIAQALLLMKDNSDSGQVKEAVTRLQQHLLSEPDDRKATLFYGYGQLFLAGDYMRKKNYMRAAELSKQGYYALDEAAEREPENWRLFYLRVRMDAFVPAASGRCVVANADLTRLEKESAIPPSLFPMLTLMHVRAAQHCNQPQQAALAQQKLGTFGNEGKRLLAWPGGSAPVWSEAEISHVLLPLTEAP